MKEQAILILGAGRSSTALINYLLTHAAANRWTVTVGDFSLAAAIDRVNGHANGKAIAFDIAQTEASRAEIATADVVVSLMPAHLHRQLCIG
jgi:saccharopine dehydrogenase (NADP+, L-glutamate forming)